MTSAARGWHPRNPEHGQCARAHIRPQAAEISLSLPLGLAFPSAVLVLERLTGGQVFLHLLGHLPRDLLNGGLVNLPGDALIQVTMIAVLLLDQAANLVIACAVNALDVPGERFAHDAVVLEAGDARRAVLIALQKPVVLA